MRKPPQGRKPQRNSLEERPSLFAVAKVHRLSTLHKRTHNFFDGLLSLFYSLIIYIIWRREDSLALPPGDCGDCRAARRNWKRTALHYRLHAAASSIAPQRNKQRSALR